MPTHVIHAGRRAEREGAEGREVLAVRGPHEVGVADGPRGGNPPHQRPQLHQKSTKWSKRRSGGAAGVRRTAHWCSSSGAETSSTVQPRFVVQNDTARATAGSW